MESQVRRLEFNGSQTHLSAAWDAFVRDSNNGTLFHQQNFLKYHGDAAARGAGSLLLYKGESLFGVIPLGPSGEPASIRSPWGASFGGPVLARNRFADAALAVEALLEHAREKDWKRISLTPAPMQYHAVPDASLEFALLKAGFSVHRRELAQGIDLRALSGDTQDAYAQDCRANVRKARRAGIEVRPTEDIPAFHAILEDSRRRLGTRPTHSADDLRRLRANLGEAFVLLGAYRDGELVGGLLGFAANARVFLNFYNCTKDEARGSGVDNLLNHEAIDRARQKGFHYYDFGTSSVDMKANEGLIKFKESFGSQSRFRDTYLWEAR